MTHSAEFEAEGRVAFRYCDAQGRVGGDFEPERSH